MLAKAFQEAVDVHCTLTRSSLPKQQVLALCILQAVLAIVVLKATHHNAHDMLQPQLISHSSELSETGGSEVTLVCLLLMLLWLFLHSVLLSGMACTAVL